MLGLDATVVLLTPIVLATASRLHTSPRVAAYACAHLANSASLLLPVSNLTNLLAFRASGLSFTRFAVLMALPTIAAVVVDWLALRRWLPERPAAPPAGAGAADSRPRRLPRFALVVLALTLAGFALSSVLAIDPLWIAVAGAVALNAPARLTGRAAPPALLAAAEPGFLVFVLGLGVIVAAASVHGLSHAVADLLPAGASLPDLLPAAPRSPICSPSPGSPPGWPTWSTTSPPP